MNGSFSKLKKMQAEAKAVLDEKHLGHEEHKLTAFQKTVHFCILVARSFTDRLANNPANNGLKELLKTAEVSQKRNRVLVTARLSPSLFSGLASGESSLPESSAAPK